VLVSPRHFDAFARRIDSFAILHVYGLSRVLQNERGLLLVAVWRDRDYHYDLGPSSEPCRLHQRLQLVPYVKALEICCRDKGPQMRCLTTAGEFFRQRPERKRKH